MKLTLLLLGGLLLLPTFARHRQQDDEPAPSSPFTSFLADEAARITKDIEGAWTLLVFDTPEEVVEPEDFRGYAQFHDGYCTLILIGAEPVRDFFGDDTAYTFLSGAYRYRIGESGTLQLSSVVGFDNLDEPGALSFHTGPDATREYEIQLTDNSLRLREPGGDTFEFRRLPKSTFSSHDLESLRLQRNGAWFDEEDDGQ
ncbi:MAG TPA: hypothetical protein ENJ09_13370 [Planctomycetes bacterium]|nr:hypothetical protein [Planctomycetota bacterium]